MIEFNHRYVAALCVVVVLHVHHDKTFAEGMNSKTRAKIQRFLDQENFQLQKAGRPLIFANDSEEMDALAALLQAGKMREFQVGKKIEM